MRPNDRKYLKSHEWCKIEGGIATLGITDYAIEHLSDLVFLDLPAVGTKLTAGEPYGEVESVKAVSDVYSPVGGEVVEINADLPDQLDTLKDDPWTSGWMVRVRVEGEEPGDLMDAAAYEKHVESEQD